MRNKLNQTKLVSTLRQNLSCFRALVIVFFVIAMVAVASFAGSVGVSSTNLQAKAGVLSNLYFQNVSGPGTSTPSVNTALTLTSSTGSYALGTSSSAYLWSPQFASATTVNAGNWYLGLWTSSTVYIIAYLPITLTNSQNSATPATFGLRIAMAEILGD